QFVETLAAHRVEAYSSRRFKLRRGERQSPTGVLLPIPIGCSLKQPPEALVASMAGRAGVGERRAGSLGIGECAVHFNETRASRSAWTGPCLMASSAGSLVPRHWLFHVPGPIRAWHGMIAECLRKRTRSQSMSPFTADRPASCPLTGRFSIGSSRRFTIRTPSTGRRHTGAAALPFHDRDPDPV